MNEENIEKHSRNTFVVMGSSTLTTNAISRAQQFNLIPKIPKCVILWLVKIELPLSLAAPNYTHFIHIINGGSNKMISCNVASLNSSISYGLSTFSHIIPQYFTSSRLGYRLGFRVLLYPFSCTPKVYWTLFPQSKACKTISTWA
jgi:hypothetical protein